MRSIARCLTHLNSISWLKDGIDNRAGISAVCSVVPVLFLVAALLLMPAWQAGNAQVGTTATVAGTVTDPSGAVVTGATVTVKSRETSIERKTITLDNGNYVVTELQPGTYSLILERAGFKRSEQKNITLVIGQRATINVQLQVGS